jgi:SulP family sulfate permease
LIHLRFYDFIGLTFFLLGFFRLGSLIGFFPRHILVGCIGGVGVFLIITGLNVSTRLQDDELSLSWNTILFFVRGHNLTLWAPAFALAGLLRIITSRWHHQLILPICAHPPSSLNRRLIDFFLA